MKEIKNYDKYLPRGETGQFRALPSSFLPPSPFHYTILLVQSLQGSRRCISMSSTEDIEYSKMTVYEGIRRKPSNHKDGFQKIDKKILKVQSGKEKVAEILNQPARQFAGEYLSGNKVIYGTGFLVTDEELEKLSS